MDVPSEVVQTIRATARLFDTQQQAVIGTTLSGMIVFWNSQAERLYGWTEHEVLGKHVVEVTPSDMSREEGDEIMQRLAQGVSWSGEFRVRHRHGEDFLVQVQDLPVRGPDGSLLGVVGTSMRSPDGQRVGQSNDRQGS